MFTLFLVSAGALVAKKYGIEYIIVLVGTTALMANVFASKIIAFFGLYITAGTIIYSASYFLTDLLSEFYGKKKAQKAVWFGFFVNLIYFAFLAIVLIWEPAPFWQNQSSFNDILGQSLRITFASLVFYLVPQLHDTWAYDFWKRKTNGKYLWVRNNASTIVSQFIDTAGFVFIAFFGVFSMEQLWSMILSVYFVKLIIATLDTPYLYIVRYFYNKN